MNSQLTKEEWFASMFHCSDCKTEKFNYGLCPFHEDGKRLVYTDIARELFPIDPEKANYPIVRFINEFGNVIVATGDDIRVLWWDEDVPEEYRVHQESYTTDFLIHMDKLKFKPMTKEGFYPKEVGA